MHLYETWSRMQNAAVPHYFTKFVNLFNLPIEKQLLHTK